jgi:NAD(P)H-nitrite reductase large subunit
MRLKRDSSHTRAGISTCAESPDRRRSTYTGNGFYEQNEIEMRVRTPVAAINAAARAVVLGSGECLAFRRLLLAAGAAPRTLIRSRVLTA